MTSVYGIIRPDIYFCPSDGRNSLKEANKKTAG